MLMCLNYDLNYKHRDIEGTHSGVPSIVYNVLYLIPKGVGTTTLSI